MHMLSQDRVMRVLVVTALLCRVSAGAFFMTADKRFILKTLVRSEANFLLDILYFHYEHVLK
jgi:hypothetical protein